jgi:hypothetical protein
MPLAIQRLVTRCRTSSHAGVQRSVLEKTMRDEAAVECAKRLNRVITPSVIRLRSLRLRVKISHEDFAAGRLPTLWADAFEAALARAAASGGEGVVCAENRAAWIAAFIIHLVRGEAGERWEYAEFREKLGLSVSQAILRSLCEDMHEAVAILDHLSSQEVLDRVLALLDDAALDQLFAAIAQAQEVVSSALTLEDLLVVARLAIAHPETCDASRLGVRRHALRLWLVARRDVSARSAISLLRNPGDVLVLLEVLDQLRAARSENSQSVTATARLASLPFAQLLRTNARFATAQAEGEITTATRLHELLGQLAPPTPHVPTAQSWVDSDYTGLLLLAGVLHRLGWPETIQRSSVSDTLGPRALGPRAITYTLAGIGLAIVGQQPDLSRRLDPGLALFAGWFDVPDIAGFHRFLVSGAPHTRRQLVVSLCDERQVSDQPVESWVATFDCLAQHLIGEFALRVRGFGRASRAFVVKHFLALPGRIRVEETRLTVIIAASPLNVVLHLSGMDVPLDAVSWLGGRGIEFQLDGL